MLIFYCYTASLALASPQSWISSMAYLPFRNRLLLTLSFFITIEISFAQTNEKTLNSGQIVIGGGTFDAGGRRLHKKFGRRYKKFNPTTWVSRKLKFYTPYEIRTEYRWYEPLWWRLRPIMGTIITTQGSTYTHASLFYESQIYYNFSFGACFGAGLYTQGRGFPMGCPLNFKSQIEIWCHPTKQFNFGLVYSHISNADIGKKNKGQESLVFQVRFNI